MSPTELQSKRPTDVCKFPSPSKLSRSGSEGADNIVHGHEHAETAEVGSPGKTSLLKSDHVAILIAGRFLLVTAGRMLYPLLPAIATAFSVSCTQASVVLTLFLCFGLICPLGGYLSLKAGQVRTIRYSTWLFALGAAVCACAANFPLFLIGLALMGAADAFIVPTAQAYLSDRSEYRRRARILGLYELCWPVAAILGVTGLAAIAALSGSISSSFWALSILAVAVGLFNTRLPVSTAAVQAGQSQTCWREMFARKQVWIMFAFVALSAVAYEVVLVAWPLWLKSAFAADTGKLAFAFGCLGAAELAGSLTGTLLIDRVGKERSMLISFGSAAVVLFLLPLGGASFTAAIALSMLYLMFNELGFIAMLSYVSNLVPGASSAVLSTYIMLCCVFRAVGSLLAVPLLTHCGFVANGGVGAAFTAISVVLFLLSTRKAPAAASSQAAGAHSALVLPVEC